MSARIIFITGTDTGVGKTVLTGLLLCHLRQNGCHALAMKPFCCGSPADVGLLHRLQNGDLTPDEINPFYFPEPLAPFVAGGMQGRSIRLQTVVDGIRRLASRDELRARRAPRPQLHRRLRPITDHQSPITDHCLLIEGAGGLLTPLGPGYSAADLILALNCGVIVASRNRLGTLNHTLLNVRALQQAGIQCLKVVLLDRRRTDSSSASNPKILAQLLAPIPVLAIPFLGSHPCQGVALKKKSKKLKKTLARLLA